MPLVNTSELRPGPMPSSMQVYNGLDCCITFEVFQALAALRNSEPPIYAFERALQAPALEMMLRGFKVDEYARQRGIAELKAKQVRLYAILDRLAFAASGRTLNPRSQKQLQELFYTTMRLPEQWVSKKGERKLSMDREVLEKLEVYFHAKPFINCILAIRENAKSLEMLETQVDPDGRMRTSINIAGTETGRWSSSKASTGSGGNLQNIDPALRYIFEATPGFRLYAIDLEQAESREVGWLCGTLFEDWSYYDACLAGDLHTITSRLVWPKLNWSGQLKTDRAIAEQPFYRNFSYRDMAKRGGHGTNYYGTPHTMSRHLKVKRQVMDEFQRNYFSAYPGIPRWHRYTAQELQTTQQLTTVFGRSRHFFGRPNDDTTLREAIAYCPQSATADRMNLIIWRLWKHMGHKVRLLLQVHDAVYFEAPEELDPAQIGNEALSHFDIPIRSGTHTLLVPGELKVGWNWGAFEAKSNPNGLVKFKGSDPRKRVTILDKVMA